MIGISETVASNDGWFRLTLPAGTYRVMADGTSTTVRVIAGRVSRLDGPDASATLGLTLSGGEIARLPLRRDASDILRLTPGVNATAYGFSVYGSSAPENAFYFDGAHLNDTSFGTLGGLMPIEFAEEVQVMTAGYPAEFGHATGGIVNVVTKNGFTPFRAAAFAFTNPRGIQPARSHIGELAVFQPFAAGQKSYGNDIGVSGSGALMRDRLFFTAGYDRLQSTFRSVVVNDFRSFLPTVAAPGTAFDRTATQNAYMAKLDLRPSSHLDVIANAFGDPGHARGAVGFINGETSTFMGTQDLGGNNGSLNAVWTSSSWLVEAAAATHRDKHVDRPANESTLINDLTLPRGLNTGGFGGVSDIHQRRNDVRFAAGHPFTFAGDHDVKAGGEYERSETDNRFRYTSGVFMRKRRSSLIYYQKRFFAVPGSTLSNITVARDSHTVPYDSYRALFAEDTWHVTSSLSANIGVRWERQFLHGDPLQQLTLPLPDLPVNYNTSLRTTNNWAPRVALFWSPAASTKITASFGRYFEQVPLDIAARVFDRGLSGVTNNTNPDPTVLTPERRAGVPGSSLSSNFGDFVFSSIRGQHIDEYMVGGEHGLPAGITGGLHLIQRRIGSVIEDFACDSDTDFCIGNVERYPLFSFDPATFDFTAFGRMKPRRDFRGAQLDLRQTTPQSSWFASYLYSKLRGNYDGRVHEENGQLDPNFLSIFDLANLMVNRDGWLNQDRRHQVKIGGSTSPLANFGVGAVFTYASGTPLASLGADFLYGAAEDFLTKRGEAVGRKRTPSLSSVDVRLSYRLPVARYRFELVADAFNLLNRETATAFDQNWTFAPGASISPGATAAMAPNKNYQKAVAWQTPRQIRFGVRVTP